MVSCTLMMCLDTEIVFLFQDINLLHDLHFFSLCNSLWKTGAEVSNSASPDTVASALILRSVVLQNIFTRCLWSKFQTSDRIRFYCMAGLETCLVAAPERIDGTDLMFPYFKKKMCDNLNKNLTITSHGEE